MQNFVFCPFRVNAINIIAKYANSIILDLEHLSFLKNNGSFQKALNNAQSASSVIITINGIPSGQGKLV